MNIVKLNQLTQLVKFGVCEKSNYFTGVKCGIVAKLKYLIGFEVDLSEFIESFFTFTLNCISKYVQHLVLPPNHKIIKFQTFLMRLLLLCLFLQVHILIALKVNSNIYDFPTNYSIIRRRKEPHSARQVGQTDVVDILINFIEPVQKSPKNTNLKPCYILKNMSTTTISILCDLTRFFKNIPLPNFLDKFYGQFFVVFFNLVVSQGPATAPGL